MSFFSFLTGNGSENPKPKKPSHHKVPVAVPVTTPTLTAHALAVHSLSPSTRILHESNTDVSDVQSDCGSELSTASRSGGGRCRNFNNCYWEECTRLHGVERCQDWETCINFDCIYRHSKSRKQKCKHTNCIREGCKFLHPASMSGNGLGCIVIPSTRGTVNAKPNAAKSKVGGPIQHPIKRTPSTGPDGVTAIQHPIARTPSTPPSTMASVEPIDNQRKIFVGGLLDSVNRTVLETYFEKFGEVKVTNSCVFSVDFYF